MYNLVMVNKIMTFLTGLSVVLLLLFVALTSPADAGPFGVLIFYILLYEIAFGLFFALVSGVVALDRWRKDRRGKWTPPVSVGRKLMYAMVLAFAPMMVLLLQSFKLENLAWNILVLVFVAVGCYYVSRQT